MPTVLMNRAQCGAERSQKKRLIQLCLDAHGLTGASLARMAGVCPQSVYRTLNGEIHSPKVLQTLRNLGVDEQYLFDPRLFDLRNMAA